MRGHLGARGKVPGNPSAQSPTEAHGVSAPWAALEREIAELGVSDKQKDRARQIFERSAEQTGFFDYGKNRLVMPANAVRDDDVGVASDSATPTVASLPSEFDLESLGLDPLLIAHLRKIPPAVDGWPKGKRIRWFRTFAMNVSEVYDDDSNPLELKIEEVGHSQGKRVDEQQ